MCGIVDADIAPEVFGSKPTEAGVKFLEWLISGSGNLVVGGKLLDELVKTPATNWLPQLQLAGRMTTKNRTDVNARADQLLSDRSCKSNDAHVIALAQISGARLLYTDDGKLIEDFKNRHLIVSPQGKIYPARGDGRFRDGSFSKSHERLLKQKNLCRG